MPLVLLCNLQENKTLTNLLTILGIDFEHVKNEDLLIKDLIKKRSSVNKLNIKETVIVMHEFDENQLDGLLQLLKSNNIKIDYKAITTTNNLQWKFKDLVSELIKEKKMIEMQNKPLK